MASRKKTYSFSKITLTSWKKCIADDDDDTKILPNPTSLFLKRLEVNKIQPCTFETYCHHGNAIRRILVDGNDCLDILLEKTPEEIILRMQEALESNSSSYYRKLMDFISIYLAFSLKEIFKNKNEKLKAILAEYRKHCFELKLKFEEKKEKNEKNEKEYDNWISFHRLQEVCEQLILKAQASKDDFSIINNDDDEDYNKVSKNQVYLRQRETKKNRIRFQEAIMVSLYILIPPCRNDLMDIKFCLYDKEKDNYFYKNDEGVGYIILNHYKTMKTYGTCEMDLPFRITNLIDDFITKFQPAAPFLFYNRQGKPYKESTFSSHISDIFLKQTDKHINIQMLRKIYATQSNFESIEKTRNVARKMGHSVKTHYQYKKNNDSVNDDDDVRKFSFHQATRQMYDPKFDGNNFFHFRNKILEKNSYVEVDAMKSSLQLIGIPEKIHFLDYNENNSIQKEFIVKFQKDNPECIVISSL